MNYLEKLFYNPELRENLSNNFKTYALPAALGALGLGATAALISSSPRVGENKKARRNRITRNAILPFLASGAGASALLFGKSLLESNMDTSMDSMHKKVFPLFSNKTVLDLAKSDNADDRERAANIIKGEIENYKNSQEPNKLTEFITSNFPELAGFTLGTTGANFAIKKFPFTDLGTDYIANNFRLKAPNSNKYLSLGEAIDRLKTLRANLAPKASSNVAYQNKLNDVVKKLSLLKSRKQLIKNVTKSFFASILGGIPTAMYANSIKNSF